MDVTIEVMVVPPAHTLVGAAAARRYEAGDIIDVYLSATCAEWTGTEYRIRGGVATPRTGFVHVTGMPEQPLDDVKAMLTRAQRDHDNIAVPEPHGVILRKRDWQIPLAQLPPPLRNRLQAAREITLPWAQARALTRRKLTGAVLEGAARG